MRSDWMGGKYRERLLFITTGKIYISPVMPLDTDVYLSFLVILKRENSNAAEQMTSRNQVITLKRETSTVA